jgi:hypothetical protein
MTCSGFNNCLRAQAGRIYANLAVPERYKPMSFPQLMKDIVATGERRDRHRAVVRPGGLSREIRRR